MIRFLKGIREREDRHFVISHKPANLKEAYQAVVTLRQIHVLSSSPAPWDKPKERKLQQARRQSEESLWTHALVTPRLVQTDAQVVAVGNTP